MELEEEQSTLQSDQFLLRTQNDVETVCLLELCDALLSLETSDAGYYCHVRKADPYREL